MLYLSWATWLGPPAPLRFGRWWLCASGRHLWHVGEFSGRPWHWKKADFSFVLCPPGAESLYHQQAASITHAPGHRHMSQDCQSDFLQGAQRFDTRTGWCSTLRVPVRKLLLPHCSPLDASSNLQDSNFKDPPPSSCSRKGMPGWCSALLSWFFLKQVRTQANWSLSKVAPRISLF